MPTAAFTDNHFGAALAAAVMLHAAVIFGVGFQPEKPPAGAPAMEITLVRNAADRAPQESTHIAAANQLGSGDRRDEDRISSDRIALVEDAELRPTDDIQPLQATERKVSEAAARRLVASRSAGVARAIDTPGEAPEHRQASPPRQAQEIASLRAILREQRQAHSKLPRTMVLTTISARAADEAEYLRHWISWVEKIGNENYPEEARRKQIYGAIRLAVTLERDGNVAAVEVLESSGQRVLDQAAIRTVRLAAPFEPIPPSIREDHIEVIRTWNFVPGDRFEAE